MVDWTTISDSQVDPNAPLTSELMTALRDNPIAIAEGAIGAPVIAGTAYNYQEFTASGTWTKPANSQSGDTVLVHIFGGGAAGSRSTGSDTIGQTAGGGGGGGLLLKIPNIDFLGATAPVTVGAGGVGRTTNGNGASGGFSRFGPDNTDWTLTATGGTSTSTASTGGVGQVYLDGRNWEASSAFSGGKGGYGTTSPEIDGVASQFGGGGGGCGRGRSDGAQDVSGDGAYGFDGGYGGDGRANSDADNGQFPAGGGGGCINARSGDGGAGLVRVWCIRES